MNYELMKEIGTKDDISKTGELRGIILNKKPSMID